jgi:hypothetical protein
LAATPITLAPPTGVPGINPHLNAVPAFTADEMARYASTTPPQGTLTWSGPPTVVQTAFLPSETVSALLGGLDVGRLKGTLIGYVELKGSFLFAAPVPAHPTPYSFAFEVFDVHTGNLLLYGGLTTSTAPPD